VFVMMTNTSPLPVHYQWFFLEQPPVVRSDPANDDEGIDVNSELEDDVESVKDNKKIVCGLYDVWQRGPYTHARTCTHTHMYAHAVNNFIEIL